MKRLFFFLFTTLILASCEQGEIPVPPHKPGEVLTSEIPLQPNYKNQVFFDLESNSIVAIVEKTSWDLAFGCGENEKSVFLNTSKAMYAAKIRAEFSEKTDTAELVWKYDTPDGNPDSTAFYGWTTQDLFIIDRGFDADGNHLGFTKIKILQVTKSEWTFAYGQLTDTLPTILTLKKDSLYNSVFFSFTDKGKQVFVEPPKTEWDLMFSHYLYIFYDQNNTPYLVAGALLNRFQTSAAKVFDKDFSEISLRNTGDYVLTSQRDVIGYDWKDYDFDANQYVVFPEKNYLIRTQEGYYFKLHFIGFYNDTGEKGFPKIEFARL